MATDLFSVLSDPTRRALLLNLVAEERSVGDLVDAVGVSQPTVSKHLKVLRDAGLAHTRVQGQRRIYALNPEPLREVEDFVAQLLPAQEGAAGADAVGTTDGEPTTAVELHSSDIETEDAQGKRAHNTVGRTVEQGLERAQEFFDRFAKQNKQRRGRRGK
ncbi:MAG: ArsR/SmtB family transcription factor [Galactobacter sp.]